MIKASSLFYAITIALIIALVSSSLILFSYFNSIRFQSYLLQEKAMVNATSGINLLLANNGILAINDKVELDLFGEGTDIVILERRNWGAFEIGISKGLSKKFTNTQIVQIGSGLLDDDKAALYLSDQNKPLSLCGTTLIKGICYLPKAGVKRAYIEGQSFVGNKLIDGEVRESSKALPEINKEMIIINQAYLSREFNQHDSIVDFNQENPNDSITHSFGQKPLYLYSEKAITLTNQFYSGNIGIVSDIAVYIGSDAKLKDIVVYAPEIIIDEGFSGNLQAFAYDTLIAGKNCILSYPSVLGLIKTGKSVDNPLLSIEEGSEITGVLFAYQEEISSRKQIRLSIGKDVIIKGQVYSNGLVELKGIIYGNLMCSKFILSTPSSVYENHLLNATIDPTRLSEHFVGINLLHNSTSKKIARWLY